jgi:hypothetical protein
MDFPTTDLMDEQAYYAQLVDWLHPDGLACPRCHRTAARGPSPSGDGGIPALRLDP